MRGEEMKVQQQADYIPRIIYQYVGMLHCGGEYRIVTRQCASIANAAREAVKYADTNGVDRSKMRICRLDEVDVKVETMNPYCDERATR
jgi:hypothetical protein